MRFGILIAFSGLMAINGNALAEGSLNVYNWSDYKKHTNNFSQKKQSHKLCTIINKHRLCLAICNYMLFKWISFAFVLN